MVSGNANREILVAASQTYSLHSLQTGLSAEDAMKLRGTMLICRKATMTHSKPDSVRHLRDMMLESSVKS